MADLGNFDANTVEPSVAFEPLPAGKYEAIITESLMKPTSKGDGRYLALTFVITRGEYEGRKLFHNLNLENPSEQAVQISRGQLSAICRAVGVLTPKDSESLHQLPMLVTVALKPRKDGSGMQNQCTAFAPKDGAAKAAPAPTISQASGKAPWAK